MDITVYDVALVPLIMALVGLLRQVGLPTRWAPLAAVVFGVAAGVVYVAPDDPAQGVLVGLALGLSAVGLYSGVKNTVQSRD
jgi:hypothetical protein